MRKPTIKYDAARCSRIEIGESALVFVLKSTRTGRASLVSTSRVIDHNHITGGFTTMNSKYIPSLRSRFMQVWNIICRR